MADWTKFTIDNMEPIIVEGGHLQPVTKGLHRVNGFDISNNQGKIDWSLAGDSGFRFAAIKRSEGSDFTDSQFDDNWKGAADYGLVRLAYHFARPSANAGHDEAKRFVDLVPWEPGDIPVLDLEDDKVPAGAGLTAYAVDFLETVRSLIGTAGMIYTGTYYLVDHGMIGQAELAQYGLWLASYQVEPPPAPAPWTFAALWQFTDKGVVPGISGPVDLDVYNGPAETLRKYGKP